MKEITIARIEGAKKKIENLNKKLDRINAAKASGWTKNPYYYSEDDIRRTEKEIKEAENRLAYWVGVGADEDAKAAKRNIKPILDFLEDWKKRVSEYYSKKFDEYYTEQEALRADYKAMESLSWGTPEYDKAHKDYEERRKKFYCECHGYFEQKTFKTPSGRTEYTKVKVKDGKLEDAMVFVAGRTHQESVERLGKWLVAEANAKYDDIVERASYHCGAIEDASNLKVGAKGQLDGIVSGNKGKCRIETIGAGGYNIQCYHFRVLIHEVKEKVDPKSIKVAKPKVKKPETKIDWKRYADEDLLDICKSLKIDTSEVEHIQDSRIKRMRMVMLVKANAFKDGKLVVSK